MKPVQPKPLNHFTVKQASQASGIPTATLVDAIRAGHLPADRLAKGNSIRGKYGFKYFISHADLIDFALARIDKRIRIEQRKERIREQGLEWAAGRNERADLFLAEHLNKH